MHGAVRNVWAKQQNDLFDKIRGQGLLVGGDGRSDSMENIVLNMAHIQQLTSKETKFFMLTLSKVMKLNHQLTWS